MATKSILKNVRFDEPKLARGFVRALENAQEKRSKVVHLSHVCDEIKGTKLKDFFGDDTEDLKEE